MISSYGVRYHQIIYSFFIHKFSESGRNWDIWTINIPVHLYLFYTCTFNKPTTSPLASHVYITIDVPFRVHLYKLFHKYHAQCSRTKESWVKHHLFLDTSGRCSQCYGPGEKEYLPINEFRMRSCTLIRYGNASPLFLCYCKAFWFLKNAYDICFIWPFSFIHLYDYREVFTILIIIFTFL